MLPGQDDRAALARDNAQRNPQRTASTAAALMIGLALVTLVAMLAAGITATFRGRRRTTSGADADYAITAQNNFSPIPIAAADAAAEAPGVEAVGERARRRRAGVRQRRSSRPRSTRRRRRSSPSTGRRARDDVLATLGDDGAFVDDGYAEDHDLHARLAGRRSRSPNGDTRAVRRSRASSTRRRAARRSAPVTISAADVGPPHENPRNLYSFVRMEGGETDANAAALERQLDDFPNAKAQTREEFIDNQIAGLNAVLNILYVLLALSVIVSLFGIVNTLVLTVFERTRELGMLRAVGMTRRQVRRMIRHESVITALIGGALGIALGLVLGALLVARVEFIDFSLPVAAARSSSRSPRSSSASSPRSSRPAAPRG